MSIHITWNLRWHQLSIGFFAWCSTSLSIDRPYVTEQHSLPRQQTLPYWCVKQVYHSAVSSFVTAPDLQERRWHRYSLGIPPTKYEQGTKSLYAQTHLNTSLGQHNCFCCSQYKFAQMQIDCCMPRGTVWSVAAKNLEAHHRAVQNWTNDVVLNSRKILELTALLLPFQLDKLFFFLVRVLPSTFFHDLYRTN